MQNAKKEGGGVRQRGVQVYALIAFHVVWMRTNKFLGNSALHYRTTYNTLAHRDSLQPEHNTTHDTHTHT